MTDAEEPTDSTGEDGDDEPAASSVEGPDAETGDAAPVDERPDSAAAPGEGTDPAASTPITAAAPADETAVEPTPTGVERRLDPRVRVLWLGRALVPALVLGVVAGVVGVVLRSWLWPGPVAFAVAFGLGAGHALARYRRWCYEVRDDALYLERGVLTEVRTVVPYVRLQHVDVSRGPLERGLGLASVVVYTAGSRGADVTVPGLAPEDAKALQARLKRLAIAAEGDDAV